MQGDAVKRWDGTTERRVRTAAALLAAGVSVTLLAMYYVPGMRDKADAGAMVLVLALPAAGLALPFVLLALLLRLKAVWIPAGALMLYIVVDVSLDLLRGVGGTGDGISVLAYVTTSLANFFIVCVAAVIDLVIRRIRRAPR